MQLLPLPLSCPETEAGYCLTSTNVLICSVEYMFIGPDLSKKSPRLKEINLQASKILMLALKKKLHILCITFHFVPTGSRMSQ